MLPLCRVQSNMSSESCSNPHIDKSKLHVTSKFSKTNESSCYKLFLILCSWDCPKVTQASRSMGVTDYTYTEMLHLKFCAHLRPFYLLRHPLAPRMSKPQVRFFFSEVLSLILIPMYRPRRGGYSLK